MSRKADPRPARTRALLRQALLELIQEKRWDRIRVQDILDRTGVGRSTFYAHFGNKFDALTAEIPAITMPIAEPEPGADPDLLPLFEHVADMRPIMLPLMSQPLLGEIMDTFHGRLADAWITHLTALEVPEPRRSVAADILAGSLMSVARRWLKSGCSPPPQQMCEEYTSYVREILAVARSPH